MPAATTTNFGTQIAPNSDGPLVIYPRAHVSVKYIYNDGTEANTTMVPCKATVSRRPHHQCGTCEVEVNASAIPFDLRRLNGIFLSVYLGAVKTVLDTVSPVEGSKQPQKYLQFVGYADSEDVKRGPDGTTTVIRARDLSALFRDLKPMYPTITPTGSMLDPTPRYSDTVLGAIQRIFQWAGFTTDQFEVRDDSGLGSTTLSTLTSEKGVLGRVPIKHRDVSAWEAIEHVGAVANVLISVDLGQIVLRRPKDAFALPEDPKTPPKYSFIFGDEQQGYVNALQVDVTKKFIRNRKGVRLIAYDPESRQVISADYPDDTKVPPRHAPKLGNTKQTKPRKISIGAGGGITNPNAIPDRPRDVIAVGGDGVHTTQGLANMAERYYRERSRQELEGTLTTHYWDDKLFDLRNGDRIEIRLKPELETQLLNQPDEGSRVAFLKDYLGISGDAARVMLAQIKGHESTLFYLRSITHEWTPAGAKSIIDFISIVEI